LIARRAGGLSIAVISLVEISIRIVVTLVTSNVTLALVVRAL
jgi:hypothetical protein